MEFVGCSVPRLDLRLDRLCECEKDATDGRTGGRTARWTVGEASRWRDYRTDRHRSITRIHPFNQRRSISKHIFHDSLTSHSLLPDPKIDRYANYPCIPPSQHACPDQPPQQTIHHLKDAKPSFLSYKSVRRETLTPAPRFLPPRKRRERADFIEICHATRWNTSLHQPFHPRHFAHAGKTLPCSGDGFHVSVHCNSPGRCCHGDAASGVAMCVFL